MERISRYRSDEPDFDAFDEHIADRRVTPHQLREPRQTNGHPKDSVPLFLANNDDDPYPGEFAAAPARKRMASGSTTILAGVCAAAAAAVLVTLFSSEATRDIAASVKGSMFPVPSAAAQFSQPRLPTPDRPTDYAPTPVTESQTPGLRNVTTAGRAPAPDDVKFAHHNALQNPGSVPASTPVAPPAMPEPPTHHLDSDAIASLLSRADALIASSDIAASRLVLRRAADAGNARAAMTLAETYDPTFLEQRGARGIVPDLAIARKWYEKAKTFGSAEASQRLETLETRRQ